MKKNLKKLFALLLVVVMVAAMFAGCANNAEKPAESRPVRTRSSTAAPPRSPVTSATHGGPTTPATRPSAT